jgi:aminopeptidase YwaD
VLCAHYDTKIETPGAIDNAAGTAALLGLAERLAGRDLDCGLEIVAFGDEEYFGSDAGVYTARFGDTFGDILAVINLDAIGQQAGSNTITWMAHSDTFEAAARAVVARYPGVEWVAPWPESSHSFFAWQGVPAVALSAQGVRGLWHSPADGTQWLSADKLAEAVDLVADLVGILHDRPLTWTGPAA